MAKFGRDYMLQSMQIKKHEKSKWKAELYKTLHVSSDKMVLDKTSHNGDSG